MCGLTKSESPTGWAKLNGANAVSFVVVKHVLENFFIIFGRWNNSSFTHFVKHKIKYFSPEGATKAYDFLCSSILALLLAHNFYIKMILLTNNSYVKKIVCFC